MRGHTICFPWFSFIGAAVVITLIIALAFFVATDSPIENDSPFRHPVGPQQISVTTSHVFYPRYGYSVREYEVGLTHYTVGEPTTPGTTMRSGRHVYDGAIALSQDFLRDGQAGFGDLVWVEAYNRWFVFEDTMADIPANTKRVDVYTHDKAVAKSGSNRTTIVIIRADKK